MQKTDEDGWRWYEGKISITTILSNAVADKKLESWFKKTTERKIDDIRAKTSDFGIRAHSCFESILKNEPYNLDAELEPVVDAFKTWVYNHNVKSIHTEHSLISEKFGFAGTLDFIGYVDGTLTLIDWKTSRNYKITNGWQLGAQLLLAREHGIKIDKVMGVQISRQTGEPKTFEYTHLTYIVMRFLHSFEVFKGLYFNKLKSLDYRWLTEDSVEKFIRM